MHVIDLFCRKICRQFIKHENMKHETLQVISFKKRVALLVQTMLEYRHPHFKKSHFFYNINVIYLYFCLFEDVSDCRDLR